jgi:drug/metabolite transporter (DMT)-like permease
VIAILGGLGAAVAWAVSTLCSSRSSRLIEPASVVAWMMVVGLVITAPLAALSGVPARLDAGSGAWLAVSGAGNVGGLVLTYRALRIGQVTLVAPLVATEGAVAAVIAVIAGERLAPGVAVTLVAIVAGIWLASAPDRPRPAGRESGRPAGRESGRPAGRESGRPAGRESDRPDRPPHPTQAVLLAIAAALAFGASLYATARAGAELPVSWVVLSARAIGTVALALPLALTGALRMTRRAVPLVVASGVCEVLGFYSYTTGSRHGIAVAAVLASQVGGLSALGAYFLFDERLSRQRTLGVFTMLAGVAVLSALRA